MRAPLLIAGLGGLLLTGVISAMAVDGEMPLLTGVLTNAAQVRGLTPDQAARAIPVSLSGVMMGAVQPNSRVAVLVDQTAGVYVRAVQNLFGSCHQGDLLAVEGVTDPGQFAPIVVARTVRRLGTAPIPAARPVTYHQLITGAMDAQWVEIKGVIRQCYTPAAGSDVWRIVIATDGGLVPVRFAAPPGTQFQEDAEVRVQAICFYQYNRKRQPLSPVLEVPREMSVRVETPAPADPYAAPVRPAASLLTFSPESLYAYAHRVHVHGVVTCFQPGASVWIRDGHLGLHIQTRQQGNLLPGDEIDVLGFPTFGAYPPVLEDSIFRKAGNTRPPVPLTLTNFDKAFDYGDDLVSAEGKLTQIQPVLDGLAFTLEKEGQLFKAVLKTSAAREAHPDWQNGSHVRITGICSIIYDDTRPYAGIWQPRSFQILLRTPADLTIVKPPPWWTPRHITWLMGIVTGALAFVTGLVVMLSRKRLRDQKRQREMAEAEFAAILSERNRLAREIHDTLAQGLAATSVQLRLAKKQANGAPDAIRHHLDAAQALVRDSLEEARNSIWNMRAHVLETGDLSSALKGMLRQMADGSETATRFEVAGRERRLAPVIENNILRVGQEAIANAIKHAGAGQIRVMLEFGEKQFRLGVSDDGRGFDPAQPPSSEGGFGLVGMRERVAELKGELNIRSAPGQGAEITLSIPLSGD